LDLLLSIIMKQKILPLFKEHSIKTIVVWQYEDLHNRDKKIKYLIHEIEKQIRKNKKYRTFT
jgi:hypothetical protein